MRPRPLARFSAWYACSFAMSLSSTRCTPERCFAASSCRKERLIDHCIRELYLIGRDEIALPKLEGPAFDRNLISERAENEATIGFEIVVFEKLLAAFEREI